MYKLEFDIFHKGCWGSDISLHYPKLKFSLIDTRWINKDISEILLVQGDNKEFNKVIGFFKKRKDILKINKISGDKENLFLYILTKDIKKIHNFSNIFFENNFFPVSPIKLEQGYEKWVLGTSDKLKIEKIYDLLEKDHKVILKYIKQDNFKTDLTNKQREILTYAKHLGYYQIPRKNSITKICKILNIPKTVFLSHLRKAEIKIINNFFGE